MIENQPSRAASNLFMFSLRMSQSQLKSYSRPLPFMHFLISALMSSQSGFYQNCSELMWLQIDTNQPGRFLQSSSGRCWSFRVMIFQILSLREGAFWFCHGNSPFRKQTRQKNQLWRSSLLVSSIPQWLFSEAYRRVPIKFLLSAYRICFPFSMYFLAIPKSIRYSFRSFFVERRKFSGLMSRCMYHLEWTYSIRLSIWSADIRTVLRVKQPPHCRRQSYNEGPSKSITIQLYSSCVPLEQTLGIPLSVTVSLPWISSSVEASLASCRYLACRLSNLTATFCPLLTLMASNISPKAPELIFLVILNWPPIITSIPIIAGGLSLKIIRQDFQRLQGFKQIQMATSNKAHAKFFQQKGCK